MSIVPKESIEVIAQSIGISNLSSDAALALAPDVEYRVREIMQEAIKCMRHSKRTTLTADDVDSALNLRNVEPIYGFASGDPLRFKRAVGHKDLFYIDDKEVDLKDVIDAPLPKAPLDTAVIAHWLAIEGVQPAIPENVPVEGSKDIVLSRRGAPNYVPISFAEFPRHGIEWPDSPQPVPFVRAELMLTTLMSSARDLFQQDPLPAIEAVQNALQSGTRAYHTLGLPKELWMAAVDSTWEEFQCLYEASEWKAHCLQIQHLEVDISALMDEAHALHPRVEAIRNRRSTLEAKAVEHRENALQFQEAAHALLAKAQDSMAIANSRVEEAQRLQVEETTFIERHSDLQCEIANRRTQVAELMKKKPRRL